MTPDLSTIELFELFLLAQMEPGEEVQAALERLGVSRAGMSGVADYVGNTLGLNEMGHDMSVYLHLLGEPLEETPETDLDPSSDWHGSRRYRFSLPLWDSYDFVVRSHPDGWAWGAQFVRSPLVEPKLTAQRPSQLQPWTVLDSEVRGLFGAPAEEYPFGHANQVFYQEGQGRGSRNVELGYLMGLLHSVSVGQGGA